MIFLLKTKTIQKNSIPYNYTQFFIIFAEDKLHSTFAKAKALA